MMMPPFFWWIAWVAFTAMFILCAIALSMELVERENEGGES